MVRLLSGQVIPDQSEVVALLAEASFCPTAAQACIVSGLRCNKIKDEGNSAPVDEVVRSPYDESADAWPEKAFAVCVTNGVFGPIACAFGACSRDDECALERGFERLR
jgi:hypothetical protein